MHLHDVATGLAIGIGLLKDGCDGRRTKRSESTRVLSLLEDSLAQLRRLAAWYANQLAQGRPRQSVTDSIARQARRLRVEVQLDVYGDESWLPAAYVDLALLVAREGLNNVSRHAGTQACKIAIDLTKCPFEMSVRDWGTGLLTAGRPGSGIALLRAMAAGVGCELAIASHPGLGTELVLVGPPCAKDRMREERAQPALSGRQPTVNGRH